MINQNFNIVLPKEYSDVSNSINARISKLKNKSNSPIELYTNLVEGKEKLKVKDLGFYTPKYSVDEKKEIIKLITEQIRNNENDSKIREYLTKIGDEYLFKCSMCKEFFLVSTVQPNISQSRDIYSLNKKETGYKLPLHNVCTNCMLGNRADSIRHFKYLCDGDFVGATRKMTQIGKEHIGQNMHADHIVPLRLGGKHDPLNIRPFKGVDNIEKKDKLTKEALQYMIENDIEFETLLTDWYVPEFKKYKEFRVKVIEACLRNIVDKKRSVLKRMPLENKHKELKRLYPFLSKKEIDRIIRKCFS